MNTVYKDLLAAAQSGDEGGFEKQVVPAGTYDTIVSSTRPYTKGKSPVIFMTLTVLNGPLAGKKSDVTVNFSDSPNARPFFVRKTKGLLAYPDAMSALAGVGDLDDDTALAIIAESWKDKQIVAEIKMGKGDYANSNELERTDMIGGAAAAAPAVAAPVATAPAPVAAPAAAPAPAQPFVGAPAAAAPAAVEANGAVTPAVTVPF